MSFARFRAKHQRFHGVVVRRYSLAFSVGVQGLLPPGSSITVEYDADKQAIRLALVDVSAAPPSGVYKVSPRPSIGIPLHRVLPMGRYAFAATTPEGWVFRYCNEQQKQVGTSR
jgi:hypothetical protein